MNFQLCMKFNMESTMSQNQNSVTLHHIMNLIYSGKLNKQESNSLAERICAKQFKSLFTPMKMVIE